MKVKCKICNKEFSNRMFLAHVSRVHKDDFNSVSDLENFVLFSRFNLTTEIAFRIISEYQNGGTILGISQAYMLPYKWVSRLLKNNGVKLKTSKEINNQKSVRDKIKKSVRNKYGVDNVSKSNDIKELKKETFIKNYGVDNIFKLDEFKDSINKIMLEKYGVKRISGWFSMSEEQKEIQIKRLCSGNSSKLEKRVGKSLIDIGFKIESQFGINKKMFDYHIKETNILIEVNGDFWHGNPKKYKSTDILPFPKKEVIVESLWKKDENKLKIALKNGYKVVTLWEMDINKLNDIELEIYIVEQLN